MKFNFWEWSTGSKRQENMFLLLSKRQKYKYMSSMTSTLAGILMQKYNHCDDENYYENYIIVRTG
jgi:hypothetical protein